MNVRRASTITNTLVNRLSSYGSEVSREKQKLTDLQLETSASLSKLHSLVENSVGIELQAKSNTPILSSETGSVTSDVSVYTNQMKSPPECLFVLNPRLFGIAVVIQSKGFVALLDSGATENFIAKKIVDSLQCKVWKMKAPTCNCVERSLGGPAVDDIH